jgi:hypothetical protein
MKNEQQKRSRNAAIGPVIILLLCPDVTSYGIGSLSPSRRFIALTKQQPFLICRSTKDDERDDNRFERVIVSQRQQQARIKPINRKPRYYWSDQTNLRKELIDFWSKLGIATNHTSPTIPNESLLVYYKRHDLRAAIVKNGGRQALSILLNNAPIMPGRWKDAIACSIELQHLIHSGKETKLCLDRPPWTNKSEEKGSLATMFIKANNTKLWSHHEDRNQKGHWNLQTVIQQMYVNDFAHCHDRLYLLVTFHMDSLIFEAHACFQLFILCCLDQL